MNQVELQLIDDIKFVQETKKKSRMKYDHFCVKLNEILLDFSREENFGNLSSEFIQDLNLNEFILNGTYSPNKEYFLLWLNVSDYLIHNDNSPASEEKLSRVETALKNCLREVLEEKKYNNMAFLPEVLANRQFIKNIYSTNDEKLTDVFLRYLPEPHVEIFQGGSLPEIIIKRRSVSTNAIKEIIEKNDNNIFEVEKKITAIQRKFRAAHRQKIERRRIASVIRRYSHYSNDEHIRADREAVSLMKDANKPYLPKCDPDLRRRIFNAVNYVELFSTVKHLTSPDALKSIFDNGLHGRQNLLKFYIPFKHASLSQCDIEEGDANVICLGANQIDPQSDHGVTLEFAVDKMIKNNPCVFYKQRDLNFELKDSCKFNIGNLQCSLNLSKDLNEPATNLILKFREAQDGVHEVIREKVKNSSLISYNTKSMHQILTLNFFRFIDKSIQKKSPDPIQTHYVTRLFASLWRTAHHKDSERVMLQQSKIYSELVKLDDKELVSALQCIGKAMTQSMEFNIYGSHKIDFSSLISIKIEASNYVLNLAEFLHELQQGRRDSLERAMKALPEIFLSHRFIDYLLDNVTNDILVEELRGLYSSSEISPMMWRKA